MTLRTIFCVLITTALISGCGSILSRTQSGSETNIHAKRSLGTAIDDTGIVGRIGSKLRSLDEQFAAMVQVDSYNKIVLLTGRVPDKGFIDQAIQIAKQTPGVRQVHSEISLGEPTTISNYWYDTWLTTKVKSQLTLTSNAPSRKAHVRSFAGYVYVMGVMTPQEAQNALYVASRVPGAKKVISLIETVNEDGQPIYAQHPSGNTTPTASPAFPQQPSSTPNETSIVPALESGSAPWNSEFNQAPPGQTEPAQ